MKKAILIIELLLMWLSIVIYFSVEWAKKTFAFTSFDEILYTLTSPVLNAGQNLIPDFIFNNVLFPFVILLVVILIIIIYKTYDKKYEVYLNFEFIPKHWKFKINLFNNKFFRVLKKIAYIIPICMLVISFVKFGNDLLFFDYLKNNSITSEFIKNEYINPENVALTFPEEKRNLIYIFVESMEATYSSEENGGAYEENYIPELTKIAQDNISFSNSELLGGAYAIYGTTWTIAGMLAQTAGVPIKTVFDGNLMSDYYNVLFPGAYSIGEILEDNGYKNYIMMGSDAAFAGRDNYFENHGNYEILDYYQAIEDGLIDEDYYVFWGFEDEILYEYAKEKLIEISQNSEPFNFTMLTVDTHTPDGYLSGFCEEVSDNPYLNAMACSDYQLGEFISWLEEQEFYDNTTVVIVGDHLSMNNYSFDNIGDYQRTIYNAFINSAIEAEDDKYYKNRMFSSFDLYPTTLASLGVEIEGNKLGLGVNLFSGEETLIEKHDYYYFMDEMNKRSIFYDDCILNGIC